MQVEAVLNIVRGVCIGLCVLAFAAGAAVGFRTRDAGRSGRNVAVAIGLIALLLVGGTSPLATVVGPIIVMLAGYLSCALGAALLGGYGAGRKRSKGLPKGVALYLVVTGLVTALALARMFGLFIPLIAIDKQFHTHKYAANSDKSCTENLTSLYFAFGKYVEYNDGLPPAESWQDQDDFKAAIQKDEWLHCPAVSNRHDNQFGYAYNAALSGRKLQGKKLNQMPNAATTPLLYDSTNLAKNAHDSVTSLPKPGRHGGKNSILFCDGHIESVAP